MRSFHSLVFAVCSVVIPTCLSAQGTTAVFARPHDRLSSTVDTRTTVELPGNVHPFVRGANGLAVESGLRMERMILLLQPDSTQAAALDQLVEQQQNPQSPTYKKFLSPQQFGSQFGVSASDIQKVQAWLETQGFTIDEIPASQQSIVFSGTAEQVAAAFNTQIQKFSIGGQTRYANSNNPSIPAALAGVVKGVVKLHSFQHGRSLTKTIPLRIRSRSALNSLNGGSHYLSPADYTTIYDIGPLYSGGVNGAGQTIAIVARSNIYLSDVETFRSQFGLPANNPTLTIVNSDPGVLEGDSTETTLDTEWSGAVAPKAAVKVVIASSTNSADGVDLSAQYIVNNNVAQVVSLSYGSCEAYMGTTELAFYNNLWKQAAAQGMTVFVSAGDSGAAGCDGGSSTTGSMKGVNGLCSSPYSVCVGGTEFNDGSNPGQYWLPGNNPQMGSHRVIFQKSCGTRAARSVVRVCGRAAVDRVSSIRNRLGRPGQAFQPMGTGMCRTSPWPPRATTDISLSIRAGCTRLAEHPPRRLPLQV